MSLSVAECPVDFENLLLAYNLHSNQGQLKTSLGLFHLKVWGGGGRNRRFF